MTFVRLLTIFFLAFVCAVILGRLIYAFLGLFLDQATLNLATWQGASHDIYIFLCWCSCPRVTNFTN